MGFMGDKKKLPTRGPQDETASNVETTGVRTGNPNAHNPAKQIRKTSLPAKMALLCGTIALLAIAGEVIVRGLEPPPPDFSFLEQKPATARLFEPRPSSKGLILGQPISINSFGIRGPEIEPKKREGCFRIIALGDSITMSPGVAFEDSFPRQLERSLRTATGSDIEVLNFGVWGYNTFQELDFLKDKATDLSPDLVLLVYFPNDAQPTTSPFEKPPASLRTILLSSHLVRFVGPKIALVARRAALPVRSYVGGLLQDFREDSVGWHESQTAILEIRKLSQKLGARFLFVLVPLPTNLDGGYPLEEIHNTLQTFCASNGVDFLDTFNVFLGMDSRELWISPTDSHFNSTGNELIANSIAYEIRKKYNIKK